MVGVKDFAWMGRRVKRRAVEAMAMAEWMLFLCAGWFLENQLALRARLGAELDELIGPWREEGKEKTLEEKTIWIGLRIIFSWRDM